MYGPGLDNRSTLTKASGTPESAPHAKPPAAPARTIYGLPSRIETVITDIAIGLIGGSGSDAERIAVYTHTHSNRTGPRTKHELTFTNSSL